MVKLVTIYDDQNIMNLLAGYHVQPDHMIFLYEKKHTDLIRNETIQKYIKGHISYILYDTESLPGILEELCDDDCEMIFDGSGGNDYALAYISRFAKERGFTIICPDPEEKRVLIIEKDLTRDEALRIPKLTVKDMVALYGGAVRTLREAVYDEEGRAVVYACLSLKRQNKKRWHQFCNLMSKAVNKEKGALHWAIAHNLYKSYEDIFQKMLEVHCFSEVCQIEKDVFFTIANPDYIQLITDVGVPLEYDIYYQLCDSAFFDDVDIRVNIDWNGGAFVGHDPESELDVVAVKDARFISISCKSGDFDSMDLYEVKVNADKFGGLRSLAVLADDDEINAPGLFEKAKELNVLLILYRNIRKKVAAQMIMEKL